MTVTMMTVAAYLIGSASFGQMLANVFSGKDLRQTGSGSTGATNALRAGGYKLALAVLILDIGKGVLALTLAKLAGLTDWQLLPIVVAVVVGHCWSVWLRLSTGKASGGKGVATSLGAMAMVSPWFLLLIPVMLAVVLVSGYVSLGSLTASLVGVLATLWICWQRDVSWSIFVAMAAVTALIVMRHRQNIDRLRSGTERAVLKQPLWHKLEWYVMQRLH